MRTLILSLPVIFLLFCMSGLQATIINVPSEYPTIQDGIDAAVGLDTVLVADGIYTGDGNRDIDFLGKAIVVMSENGAESCVIDCEADSLDPHRGFYFHSGESFLSMVKGFTIQNGHAWGEIGFQECGGGILCHDSSPIITENIIVSNWAGQGGGIYCAAGSPLIVRNTISGNSTYRWGAYLLGFGGGITIHNIYSSNTIIEENLITDNTSVWGGGIFCWTSDMVNPGDVLICGNTITNNTSIGDGWGCGGGLMCFESEISVINSILWDNEAAWGNEIFISYEVEPPSIVTISYSDVEGGQDSIYVYYECTLNWGEGMLDSDPLFTNPAVHDYTLLNGSPCIDAGDPTYAVPLGGGCRIDMGAYEYWKGFNCWKENVPVLWQ